MKNGIYTTHSERGTELLAAEFGASLTPNTVIALSGELGAGKTAFTRGIAEGLGFAGAVSSPTFTIVNEYHGGRLAVFHFDLYRLSGADDVYDIGWNDYLERGGVIIAEWSERAADLLPEGTIYVDIGFGEFRTDRILRVSGAN
ncbi:MAG: tRNA (adenosine(37)-N6)-threonylcarbamoyltransferase complex ATPase subunit type 1 TsaE [Oscillospiraceae bacterium]|jgi:tRNA threonylcarbamoyladenosine biosynthesis protein TsaE|nr:tRNA (adenosine(37)-N6)-threonylcarbamoyltransferase complex ATPase subunit type 1 TsaE [Oscillospiraceae bacterium]